LATPKAVPIKTLFPLLEGASLDEDENLHDMWAALLANAALDEKKVPPGFVAILKEMSPDEAMLLRWISEQQEEQILRAETVPRKIWRVDHLLDTYVKSRAQDEDKSFDFLDVEANFDALLSAQLVHRFLPNGWQKSVFWITSRGYRFLKACRPPAPKYS